jgi:hypothetical protein
MKLRVRQPEKTARVEGTLRMSRAITHAVSSP